MNRKIISAAFTGTDPAFILQTIFGHKEFRGNQQKIIEQVLSGHDCLAIMPTGGGKSLCYQIPALILPGITIVVSPLISLMQNQVKALKALGIDSLFFSELNSQLQYNEAITKIKNGNIKIIYVSPESLSGLKIRRFLNDSQVSVSCITIDEAHCISEWGHDFRPDYMDIRFFHTEFPDATLLALTATATERVRSDIIKNLRMKKPEIFISSFNRKNIYLEVQPKINPKSQILEFLQNHNEQCGIIYCFSRSKVDEIFNFLKANDFTVTKYHAGLSDKIRTKNQEMFISGKVKIIVATVAFGMGIDKSDVRFVINYDLPKSLEEYYQEIGRAGRDGLASTALLLFNRSDEHKIRYFFEDCANPQQSEKNLQKMIEFSTANTCRRKVLLKYFGETYEPHNPGEKEFCCDICTKALGIERLSSAADYFLKNRVQKRTIKYQM